MTKAYKAQTADAVWQGNVFVGVASFSPVNPADPLSITRVNLTAHGFVTGSKIEIANSQYYSGTYAVASASNDSFDIDTPYHFGDINLGAWGGRGNEAQHTFNGRPAYILKNSILLESNASIIGFNPGDTVVVKSAAEIKIKIKGNSTKSITGVRLCGWSFDGRGNIDNLGGLLQSGTNGGAFEVDYASRCELNCHIINHHTTAKGGAIFGSAQASPAGSTFGRCDYITAEHIVNNRADAGGGGAYGCNASKLSVSDCYSNSGASGADACFASMLVLDNCSASFAGKNIIYENNQQASIQGPLQADSINTGQGAFKINSIAKQEGNQNLKTTDNATFNKLNVSTINTGYGDLEINTIAKQEGDQNLKTTDNATFNKLNVSTINTGYGDLEINSIAKQEGDQNLKTTDSPTFNRLTAATINTGHGDMEVNSIAKYQGDQNLKKTDSPTFSELTVSTVKTANLEAIRLNASRLNALSINTGYGDLVINSIAKHEGDQNLKKTDNPTFNNLKTTTITTSTIKAGYGAYKVNSIAQYAGNQNLRTTDSPTFNNLKTTHAIRTSTVTADSIQLRDNSNAALNRVIAGNVRSDGTSSRGKGFTSKRNSVGDYTITFDVRFRISPIFVATSHVQSVIVSVRATSPNSVSVRSISRSGVLSDALFFFMAMETS